MFLMFQLERPDVLAWGDLGIRSAVRRWWELDALPDRKTLEALAEPWRPQRTLACRYLWRSLDNEPGLRRNDPRPPLLNRKTRTSEAP